MAGDVTIIGGGWSVRDIDLRRLPGIVIAVNDSAIYAPVWNVAVSMDRLWTEARIGQLERLIESEDPDRLRDVYIRRSALQNLKHITRPWLHAFECDHVSTYFSGAPAVLNGTNSGACALNLAWQMNPSRVFLLGFDMTRDEQGRAYWYPPYPWSTAAGSTSRGKYDVWSKEFGVAAALFGRIGCKVFNVSPSSAIKAFPKMTAMQFHKAVE